MSRPDDSVTSVLDRMVVAVLGENAHFQSHALALGIPRETIKSWKRRGEVPLGTLKNFALDWKVPLDWLQRGDMPDAHQANEQARSQGLSEDESELLENYRRCTPSGRRVLLASSAEMALAAKPRRTLQPNFGVGAQPGKVSFQVGQNKQGLMSCKPKSVNKKTKKEDE